MIVLGRKRPMGRRGRRRMAEPRGRGAQEASAAPARPGRRQVLRSLGGLGGLAVAAPLLSRAAPALVTSPDVAGAPRPEQLHLQFGADAARDVAVSWAARRRAGRPVVRLG